MSKTLFIFSILFSTLLISQENTAHQWYFGYNCGVNFSTGIPVADTDGALYTGEGCATVGDINGNLLFYTDGQDVYNKNHQTMPNGTGLMGSMSATQSSIIVPYPESDSLFYIFTVDAVENHLVNGLRYSIVDMSLNGGLGDVTSTKNILLETPVSEKITAVLHSNNKNIWLLSHRWDSDEFIAYEITPLGIDTTPVVSAIGSVHQGGYSAGSNENGWTNAIGYMKANMQGTKIALAIYRLNIYELFDFNKLTGVLSNYYQSAPYTDAYGVEFSPDGSKLYGTVTVNNNIYQFDITQTNPFDSPATISSSTYQTSGLQLAPNGKIYVSELNNGFLSVINSPNQTGSNCNYESNSVYLEGNICRRGLPSIFFYKGFKFFTGSEIDTSICQGDSSFFENTWQTETGTYYDTLLTSLGWDSIINTNLTILPTIASPIISESLGILTSSIAPNYQWYYNGNIIVGATNQQYQPLVSGTYYVSIDNGNGCLSFSNDYYFIYNNLLNNTLNKIKIYPNPAKNYLLINNISSNCEIELISFTGNICKKYIVYDSSIKINLKDYEKGIYLVRINTNNISLVKKLIIK